MWLQLSLNPISSVRIKSNYRQQKKMIIIIIIWLSSSEEHHHHATINNPHVQTLDGYMPLMYGTPGH